MPAFEDSVDSPPESFTGLSLNEMSGLAPPSRKSTLFELSMVSNTDSHSLATTSSRSRNSKIAQKLASRFGLDTEDLLMKEYPCWLLKDVLIQGHIFLTAQHLLFFAFLPKNSGVPKMTGGLSTTHTGTIGGRQSRYWAMLKDHTLSLYNSPTELYFPVLTIDLRYANKVELCKHDGKATPHFKVFTDERTFKFHADSQHAARSWCGALKKQVFAAQHSNNNSMSVKIPLSNILDLDEQPIVEHSSTLRIRVLESSETFAVDDYFFMFFDNSGSNLKETINLQLAQLGMDGSQVQVDFNKSTSPVGEESNTVDNGDATPKRGRSPSILKRVLSPVSRMHRDGTSVSLPVPRLPKSPNRVKQRLRSVTDSLVLRSPGTGNVEERIILEHHSSSAKTDAASAAMDAASGDIGGESGEGGEGGESGESSDGDNDNDGGRDEKDDEYSGSHLSVQKEQDSILGKSLRPRSRLARWTPRSFKNVGNMWAAHPFHYQNGTLFSADDTHLVEQHEQAEANRRFRHHFSLGDSESLVATYYAYLNKNIPVYGKIYLGQNVLCFRSLIPGSKTKMILPIDDVENCYKERGFRFGYFGLVLVIHGHEELFFEFGSKNSRDDAEGVLLVVLDALKPMVAAQTPAHAKTAAAAAATATATATPTVSATTGTKPGANAEAPTPDRNNAARFKLFEDKISAEGFDIPLMVEENPYYKTIITPKKSYRFGLLTIGSRGDVQPYIALGKGLVKEGHRVTIITHREFGPWIESHGLEFREIAGNPAHLMSLMVQHGSMNVGLLREASTHFRGWIKELLASSWKACQGLDILIESPSAMAGIHIAEALRIPYFRAFTMPWTRTRAYPHAFIVPDQKRGGNYNYLTHVLFENIFWRGISGQVNKWRVESLGVGKTNLDLLQQNKVPFLYNISPAIFPPSVDFSEWVKVTGYWFLDERKVYEPPAPLVEFISRAKSRDKKLVYIGFGSIVVSDPKEMTRAVVDAVVDAGVYCILNKGWSERLGGGASDASKAVEIELPDCVYNAGSVPHDWLFPQLDAAVHHGGSGTTGATLRAGLPTVIKPFFGDQFFYAGRVEDIGAGVALRKLNSKSLSRALKEVTTNSRMINKARLVSEEIGREDGVQTAIGCIYSELEYARSLILAKTDGKRKAKEEQEVSSERLDDGSWLLV